MGIFDAIFNPQIKQQPVAGAAANPNPAGPAGATATGGGPQLDAVAAKSGEQAPSPMDKYKGLWDNDEPKEGTQPAAGTGNPPSKNSNPAEPDFAAYAKTLNFAQSVNPELAQKALAGDVAALTQIINTSSQASFAASAKLAHQLAKRESKIYGDSISAKLPGEFKKFALRDTSLENPAFDHPGVKPMIEAIKQQMAVKHPDASTEELTRMSKEYVTHAFGIVSGDTDAKTGKVKVKDSPATERQKSQAEGNFNWDGYLAGENE